MAINLGNKRNAWLAAAALSASLVGGISQWESSGKVITVPYEDIVGVLTVCDGITGPQVIRDKTYTKADCAMFRNDHLKEFSNGVLGCTTAPLSQNQHDAMVMFSYNVGIKAYCESSLLKKLNAGDYVGACNGLIQWVNAGGKRVQGLVNRREYERKLCLKGST